MAGGFFRTIIKGHFFFPGVTKLFPLFPIISAFENTELVLLFAVSIYCRS